MKIYIPLSLPFGIQGDAKKLESTKFHIKLNKLRELTKHQDSELNYTLKLFNGCLIYVKPENEINYMGFIIPARVMEHYMFRHDPGDIHYTLIIEIENNLEEISSQYSAPGDIKNDIIVGLINFVYGSFNIAGFARFSPVVLINESQFFFNGSLAYMMNPWQDWYCDAVVFKIILDQDLKSQISKDSGYEQILPHVKNGTNRIDLNNIIASSTQPEEVTDNIIVFGRLLSEIIRFHPSHDYSVILSILTALIEGLLKINGENRYKFKIKISNLLNDINIPGVLNKIYDSRSAFFHSAKYNKLNDIFEVIRIYFLLIIAKNIINYSRINNGIQQDSFDFGIIK